jgi:RNA polymerase sigma factor (sigma-70 family)
VPLIQQFALLDDPDLIRLIRMKKNNAAFHELVRRHRRLAHYPLRAGMGERDAVDLLCRKLADCINSYELEHGDELVRVLTVAMQRATLDYLRAQRRQPTDPLTSPDGGELSSSQQPTASESAEDVVIGSASRDDIVNAIQKIENSHQRIILLALAEGATLEEITRDYRRSPKWIDNQYQRAKKQLRLLLPREQWLGRAKHHRRPVVTADEYGEDGSMRAR